MMRHRRDNWVWGLVLVIGALSSGCNGSSEDNPIPPVVQGKCAGVWSSRNDQCLKDNPCIGFQCLDVLSYCKGQADQALALCCATNFSNDPSDQQTCLDTFGDSP
jgi:hypothetical protein